jgi:hypothetical protein
VGRDAGGGQSNQWQLAYAGSVLCGQNCASSNKRNRITATLNDAMSARTFIPVVDSYQARSFRPLLRTRPAALHPESRRNRIWFFRFALRSTGARQAVRHAWVEVDHGRFGGKSETPFSGTLYDNSLFEQQPAAVVDCWWNEEQPASFLFELPGGVVLRKAGANQDPDEDRVRLFALLQQTISLMRAAGVNGRVEPRPLRDAQRQRDLGRVLQPLVEETRMEDRLSALSALFDASANDGSRFG